MKQTAHRFLNVIYRIMSTSLVVTRYVQYMYQTYCNLKYLRYCCWPEYFLSVTGELSNYKSKIQLEEFQFGMSMAEPEPSLATTQETEVNPDDLDLLPAEDENSIHFTGTETSDMLFWSSQSFHE